ncbi:DUF317 domain-containing protein [Streptomyces sp. NPDC047024]|uniref:DUF317 domain-containing protein n=1 Tax=Streptomyces sp. NPDC047024 TaxID=3155476 RepID=UPI003406FBB4
MKKKQWRGWGPAEPAEQHYLVQPRTLAGSGDVRHVSAFLRASGWREHTREGGPLIVESPDRTVRIAYDPYSLPGGWTIEGAADNLNGIWSAHLGRDVPVEIVAGLTDSLTLPRSAHAPNVWEPLEEQRWHTRAEGEHYTATSPDGTAWMQYRQSPDGSARWWSGAMDSRGTAWTAIFTPTTPMHLVQAFSTALANPDPVMRPRGRVPLSTQVRTWSVSVTPSQLNAWQQARITAARAATWARNSAQSTRPRTRARPSSPVGAARTRR